MNTAGVQEVPNEDSLDQACAWIARLRSDATGSADRREFARWLSRSAENRNAFDAMTELWGDLGALAHLPIDELYPESRPAAHPPQETHMPSPRRDNGRAPAGDAIAAGGWNPAQWLMGGGLVAACLAVALWVGNQWPGGGDFREQTSPPGWAKPAP